MWTEYFVSMLPLMFMASLLRISYELNRMEASGSRERTLLPQTMARPDDEPGLTSQQREWAKKAVTRYSEAQEKKWRHWNVAMFERVH